MADTDIETHFTVIAAINLILALPALLFGSLLFLGGLIGGGFAEAFSGVPGIGALIASAGFVIGFFVMLFAVPGLVSAIGLLRRERWAKVWTIVVAVLHLFNVPLGTAFGIYSIWAMTQPETEQALS